MPKAKDKLRVAIEQETTGDDRAIKVSIVGKVADFVLADQLSAQGAIDTLESRVNRSVREATEAYIDEAQAVVSALAERRQERQAGATGRAPKRNEAVKDETRGATLSDLSAAPKVPQERVNGQARV